jgi:phospholipid/cholesterol/gamma-HCH transport system substrate-binding protein
MRRLATGTLLVIALVGAAVFAVGAGNSDGGSYEVRAIFDDVASAVPGEDVKIAGAKIGAIESMDVTPQNKAAVVLNITDSDFAPFHRDAHCTVRPQSLIGEKYVECDPGTGSYPALRKIHSGTGKGQYLLPLANTSAPVDLDLVNNVMRLPYRQRFAIILSELGTGFAGRGEDLNAVIHRANPALRETDKVLKQLADENVTLKNLASESDQALAPLARERGHLAGFIKNAGEVGAATAQKSRQIEASINKLPAFLRQLKPTLQDLGSVADEMTPTLTDLDRAAPGLSRLVLELGPFSRSATISLRTLGQTTDVGGPVLKKARPVVQDLRTFAKNAKPVATNLDDLTASLDRTGGLEQAMNYIFFQMTAINGFDEISHYLRASLLVNTCSTYATTLAPGCGAHFSPTASVSSAQSSSKTPDAALDNKGNAPKATKAGGTSAASALANVARGLMNLASPSNTDTAAKAEGQAGITRLRQAAASDSSPALNGVGGRDQALLNYLLGSG